MEWEDIPNDSQFVRYDEAIPSSSNALIKREDVMSGPCVAQQEGASIFERISIRNSKNVEFGSTRNYYYQNITQVVPPSEQLALQNIPTDQNESLTSTIDDEFLQNVPYLRSLYSTENAYMSSLLWDDDERDYSLKDYFIDLKLDEEDLLGKFKKKQDIPLESIFLPDKGERNPNRILITGNPGYGKSTICSKLAYDWAMREPPHYLSHFDILVVIQLHQLGGRTIEDVVVDILADEETDIEKFKKSLCKSKHQFLILLDGLDEAADITDIEKSLKPHKNPVRFPKNTTILLTSRSHAAKQVHKLFHRHLCVSGFTDEKQKEYIKMFFFTNQHAQTSICNILLSEESVLNEFASCPLMLHMMCCLHEEINLSSLKRTTDIYLQVFNLFFIRYESKYDCHPLLQEGQYLRGEYFLLKLGKISFDILSGKLPEIKEKELNSAFNKQDEYDMLLKLGLLKTSRIYSRGKMIITFEVLHRVFLEFLAAFFFYYEMQIVQNTDNMMIEELLEHQFCENFLISLAGLLKEKFHLIVSDRYDNFNEWEGTLCSRLLKESGHTKENMEVCKKWLQRIDIDTSMYHHNDVESALPLALKCKNSVTERICFKFTVLDEYLQGRYYVISPKLLRAMKDCKTLKFIEIFILFEILKKDDSDDKIAFIDLVACFPFLKLLLQIKKEVLISIALHSDIDFDPYLAGEFIEENETYMPLLLETVNEGHELLEEENFIIHMNQSDGATLKFMIFPNDWLPPKLFLCIYGPDFEDFTDTPIFKHILKFLESRNMTIEIYVSEEEDMHNFDTKVYPLGS